MARVVYRDENYQTFYVDINAQQPEVTIGRNPGNKVVIPAKSLSRYHAKIIYQNGHYFLLDLKSSNGSFVNGARVQQQEIHPGDKLRFGDVKTVEFIDEIAPAQAPHPMGIQQRRPPSSPMAMPKLGGPTLQAPQINAPASDLRSVTMRPITSQGTYRPTMPNQPAFDDEMAKLAATQMAAPMPSPAQSGLAPRIAGNFSGHSGPAFQSGRNAMAGTANFGTAPQDGPHLPDAARPHPKSFQNGMPTFPAQPGMMPPKAAASFVQPPQNMAFPGFPNTPDLGAFPPGTPKMPARPAPSLNMNGATFGPMADAPKNPDMPVLNPLPPKNAYEDPENENRDTGDQPATTAIGPEPEAPEYPSSNSDALANAMQDAVAQVNDSGDLELSGETPEVFDSSAPSADIPASDEKDMDAQPVQGHDDSLESSENRAAKMPCHDADTGAIQHQHQTEAPKSETATASSGSHPSVFAPTHEPAHIPERMPVRENIPADSSTGTRRVNRAAPLPRAVSGAFSTVPAGQGFGNMARARGTRAMPTRQRYAPKRPTGMDQPTIQTPDATENSHFPCAGTEAIQNDTAALPNSTHTPVQNVASQMAEHAQDPHAVAPQDSSEIPAPPNAALAVTAPDESHPTPEAMPDFQPAATSSDNDNAPIPSSDREDHDNDTSHADSPSQPGLADSNLKNTQDDAKTAQNDIQDLKNLHAQEIDAMQRDIQDLKNLHAQEIDAMQIENGIVIGNLEAERDALQASLQQANARIETLETENADNQDNNDNSADALTRFLPSWKSRFNVLLQYAKAMERAADKLGIDAVEPKTVEYLRSMTDMIRFCADDLTQWENKNSGNNA